MPQECSEMAEDYCKCDVTFITTCPDCCKYVCVSCAKFLSENYSKRHKQKQIFLHSKGDKLKKLFKIE